MRALFILGIFTEMKEESIVITTDGSSLGNPGPGGFGAIIIKKGKVREVGGGEKRTTNNRMELSAAIAALEAVREETLPMVILADSQYVINGITKWVKSWEKRGWTTVAKEAVLNRDLWEKLLALSEGKNIEWKHVYGHSGHALNERADAIAQSFALGAAPDLYSGDPRHYFVDSTKVFIGAEEKRKSVLRSSRMSGGSSDFSARRRSLGRAYSYVSMIGKSIQTHRTWDECKKRVEGKRGAKYRKTFSKEDEAALIALWKK